MNRVGYFLTTLATTTAAFAGAFALENLAGRVYRLGLNHFGIPDATDQLFDLPRQSLEMCLTVNGAAMGAVNDWPNVARIFGILTPLLPSLGGAYAHFTQKNPLEYALLAVKISGLYLTGVVTGKVVLGILSRPRENQEWVNDPQRFSLFSTAMIISGVLIQTAYLERQDNPPLSAAFWPCAIGLLNAALSSLAAHRNELLQEEALEGLPQ